MKLTKWELYKKLELEFNNTLPEVAHKTDVSISEAHYDKFSKDYYNFHQKEKEMVNFEEIKDGN